MRVLTAVHVANVIEREEERQEGSISNSELDSEYLVDVGVGDRVEVWRKQWQHALRKVINDPVVTCRRRIQFLTLEIGRLGQLSHIIVEQHGGSPVCLDAYSDYLSFFGRVGKSAISVLFCNIFGGKMRKF